MFSRTPGILNKVIFTLSIYRGLLYVLFTIQPLITTDLLTEMLHTYMCFL